VASVLPGLAGHGSKVKGSVMAGSCGAVTGGRLVAVLAGAAEVVVVAGGGVVVPAPGLVISVEAAAATDVPGAGGGAAVDRCDAEQLVAKQLVATTSASVAAALSAR